jgi:hypothetical protein
VLLRSLREFDEFVAEDPSAQATAGTKSPVMQALLIHRACRAGRLPSFLVGP